VEKKSGRGEKLKPSFEQEAMRFPSERHACPRKELPSYKSPGTGLPCQQTEEASELVWHPEELDANLPRSWHTRITPRTLGPAEPKACPLRPRKDRRSGAALAGWTLSLPDLDLLITHQLHTSSPMLPAAPVIPEERRSCDREGMQQDTDLPRLCGSSAIPLALLAQGTRPTTANAGSVDDAQAPIGFSALFMWEQLLVGRATQRAIGLESKVLATEAARFPGQAHVRRSIA